MLFSVPLDDFEIDYIHYTKSKQNIIMNGLFTKILYSDNDIVMNGLFVHFVAKVKYVHNKTYYVLDEKCKKTQDMFRKLIHMENDILLYYKNITHQTFLPADEALLHKAADETLPKANLPKANLPKANLPKAAKSVCLIKSQLEKGVLKYIPHEASGDDGAGVISVFPANIKFVLKISGIWQNDCNIGLNYKIVAVFEK